MIQPKACKTIEETSEESQLDEKGIVNVLDGEEMEVITKGL